VELPPLIAAKIASDPVTGCWRWLGYVGKQGYGQVAIRRRTMYVHRAVYELLVGPIPHGWTIDHVQERGCRYRDCVNPDHMEPVTISENARRGQARRHARECAEQAERIRAIRRAPGSHAEVGRAFGISTDHASRIRRRLAWKGVS
jgi:hypothetical protein